MHLSPEFGLTYRVISRDFKIDKKVEMMLSSDTGVGVAKSIGVGIMGLADALVDLDPDIIVLLGDRFETFAAATSAMCLNIPIAHIHGGELTEGAIDDAIRHSITKMSHLHFTSTESYRRRVIQLGEDPSRVFNVGALGLDNLNRLNLLSRSQIEKELGWSFRDKNVLVTFHPVTLEPGKSTQYVRELLGALEELPELGIIFTAANADHDGMAINAMIRDFCFKYSNRAVFFANLGQLLYLSTLKHVDAVVGNSSSGIIEAPSLRTATINIGNRQKGRIKAESVIDCRPMKGSIKDAIVKVFSNEFKAVLNRVENPYGDGNTSARIMKILKEYPLNGILKKNFYDLNKI
ncbi:UDP-N-acetylglucosamine 2-epimerase [Dissulfuribacter thermophilus]|uniref:UDP-N-acetylglucosamine 2-epimerase n=2 Tax=Dissulfuribacter thermophilus TaxID=1156395 RepID=A0A1B9F2K0_9BACT|nr:UDP-N-acetylglucosamine 2-epimerase [Dissulfuribacter thermophilus]